jgi:guanosine-3',5'-bis(diphosphate) 3'-pyrophosphohydrolase
MGKFDCFCGDDLKLVRLAEGFVADRLSGEKISGESVLDFNLRVGEILGASGLPVGIVFAGILYGCEEVVSFEDLKEVFGEDVAGLVFGQLQFRRIRAKHLDSDAGLIRKILISGLDDVRVVFVKLAVKLANLETVGALERSEQKRICEGVLDLYVPLAERLGLSFIRNRLEDLAFQNLHKKKYKEILNFFEESRDERASYLDKLVGEVSGLLKGSGVGVVRIKGRDKSVRSIYGKIVNRGIPLDKQRDHYAIRVVVKDIEGCYGVLGVLHERFLPVEGRLKDYIASPKPNGYRSIHTEVVTKGGRSVEVQIRTVEMDEFAEEGGAAHWLYKGGRGDFVFEKKVGYLKAFLDSQREGGEGEFMKNLKLDLFADKIYCYTPRGDVRELPRGASVLDFAYSIHQEVGSRAVGARVDGRFVSLKEVLRNNCVVEVLTNKAQRPRRSWLKAVVSSRARAKIRKGIRKYEDVPVQRGRFVKAKDVAEFDSLVSSEDFPRASFSLAKCCNPVPCDELVGVMKSSSRVLVHRVDCSKVAGRTTNVVPVYWKGEFSRALDLRVLCRDRSGILSDLLNTISRLGFVVRGASAKIVGNDEVECRFEVIPRELEEVEGMVERIRKVRSVFRVWFES